MPPVVDAYVRLPAWHPEAVTTFLDGVLPDWRDPVTWVTPDAAQRLARALGADPTDGPTAERLTARWLPNAVTGRWPSLATDDDGGVVLGLSVDTALLDPGAVRVQVEQTLGHLMRLARRAEGYATWSAPPPANAAAWRRAVRDPNNLLSTA